MSNFNIHIEGRGIWYTIHLLAFHANTDLLKNAFIITIGQLADHFGCETCKVHFKKFITDVPIKPFLPQEYGVFKWTVELHNAINKKLNKPVVKYEDALSSYKNFVCQHCDDKMDGPHILVPVDNKSFSFHFISY